MGRDKYHFDVKEALEKDGWTITHDPFYLKFGRQEFYIDLGAERLIAAEKGTTKIAVEIKTFSSLTFITAFYEAIGQYLTYEEVLKATQEERSLFLAVPFDIYQAQMEEPIIEMVLKNKYVCLVIYNPDLKTIVKWIQS